MDQYSKIQFDNEMLEAKYGLYLESREEGLTLTDGVLELRADLTEMLPRLKQSNLERELLVKAARLKNVPLSSLHVLDATAGFGEDSLLLAAAGCRVTLYEYNPVIAALLQDALDRALKKAESDRNESDRNEPDRNEPKRSGWDRGELSLAVSRMKLICGDSISAMRMLKSEHNCDNTYGNRQMKGDDSYGNRQTKGDDLYENQQQDCNMADRIDVILLDPMFPERQKSALIKKKFQLLQKLELPCSNEFDLLDAAFAARPRKIIIKRPLKGPYLAGRKPDYSIEGKAIRYDCIYVL